MDEIEIIYLDMDGVLCDFHTEFKIKSGVSTVQYEAEHGTKKFWEFVNDQGLSFWSEMTPMQDMEELKSFVFDLLDGFFVTTCGCWYCCCSNR